MAAVPTSPRPSPRSPRGAASATTGAGADAPTRAEGDAAALWYAAATRREAELVAAAAHADERREAACAAAARARAARSLAPQATVAYMVREEARAQRELNEVGAKEAELARTARTAAVEELTALATRYRAELATADKRADVGRARLAALARGRGRQRS